MKKIIAIVMLAVMPAWVLAGGGAVKTDAVEIDLKNNARLQNGAKLFVNYCLSCHSAAFMRYNRMGRDLGIDDKTLASEYGFITNAKGEFKPGSLMQATMPAEEAKMAFNAVPPDLSVIARSRGERWLYTYLRSFYRDPSMPSGWNNTVFDSVSMPHVMWNLQGVQQAVYRTEQDSSGKSHKVFERFELVTPGTMSKQEFDDAMRDLTTFLVYLGEPAKLVRKDIGTMVLLFLGVLFVLTYLLKRNYWKDIH